jgi:hypothetical protein
VSEPTPLLSVVDLGDGRVRVSVAARPTEWIAVPDKDWQVFTERLAAGKRPYKRDPVQHRAVGQDRHALWHTDAALGGTLWLTDGEWATVCTEAEASAAASAKTEEEGTD